MNKSKLLPLLLSAINTFSLNAQSQECKSELMDTLSQSQVDSMKVKSIYTNKIIAAYRSTQLTQGDLFVFSLI